MSAYKGYLGTRDTEEGVFHLYSVLKAIKVRGPFVENFCIEKDWYIDAI